MAGSPVGSRCSEFFNILDRADEYYDYLDDRSLSFAEDMKDALAKHGERTRVSAAQIKWIRSIESKIRDADDGTAIRVRR